MSVTIWRLRPLIRFPASYPLTPPLSVVFTLWLSAAWQLNAKHSMRRDDPRRWLGFAALGQTRGLDQLAVQLIQHAVIAPGVEIASDRGDRREVVGQHAPLAPSRRDIEDRIEHVAQMRRARSAGCPARRHQWLDQRPFPRQHRTKLHSTNPIERLNKEVKRRADVVGIFPNEASITRLIGAVLFEQNDEWQTASRYMMVEAFAEIDTEEIDPILSLSTQAA